MISSSLDQRDSISELSKPLDWNVWSGSHIKDSGMAFGGYLAVGYLGTWPMVLRLLGGCVQPLL